MTRLALIGANWEFTEFAAVAQRIRGARFNAVCDQDSCRADAAATETGAEINGRSLVDLLETHHGDIDAIVATWDGTTDLEDLVSAVRAGKHILLEVTSVDDSAAIDRLVSAANDSGSRLMVGRPQRFLPSIQTIRNSILAGQLGRPGLIRVHRWKYGDGDGSGTQAALVPDLDLVCWLFGTSPEAVVAVESETDGSRGNLLIHLGFPNGGMAMIDLSERLPDGGDYFSLSVIGSSGSAITDDHHNQQLVFGGGDARSVRTGHAPLHRLGMLQEFVDSIRDGKVVDDCVGSVRTCSRVADAIRQSLASGQSVELERSSGIPNSCKG